MIWVPVASALASPILKAPLLIAATRVMTWAQRPPTPPATQEESAKYGPKRDAMSNVSPLTINQTINWALALCESAVVLAGQFPSELSQRALSVLARSPSALSAVRVTPIWLAGCALMAGGGLLRLACYRTLGKFFTWELAVKKDHVLVTHGPYSVVRHPAYTGSLMIGVGVVLAQFGPGSWYRECIGLDGLGSKVFVGIWSAWALAVPTLLMRRVNAEDAVLKKEFNEEW
ncbi:hypothetical protein PHLGIDRAFT_507715, partial [Phlebiopsis gigantea 11061_1 CR5-6]